MNEPAAACTQNLLSKPPPWPLDRAGGRAQQQHEKPWHPAAEEEDDAALRISLAVTTGREEGVHC
jgi:hypothetical protein